LLPINLLVQSRTGVGERSEDKSDQYTYYMIAFLICLFSAFYKIASNYCLPRVNFL